MTHRTENRGKPCLTWTFRHFLSVARAPIPIAPSSIRSQIEWNGQRWSLHNGYRRTAHVSYVIFRR